MTDGGMEELRAELLDDFYAECDEHLSTIRRQLITLDQSPDRETAAGAIDACFRSLHSLKGNLAIVGLHAAERLAHAAEDVLRDSLRSQAAPGRRDVEWLASASQRLEQIVAAHRLHAALPDVADVLAAQTPTPPARAGGVAAADDAAVPPAVRGEAGPGSPPPVRSAPPPGKRLWRCTFSPSRELDQRGVNINSVRQRLSAVGEILAAVPCVQAGGSIRFEFTVGVPSDSPDPDCGEEDGLVLEPAEPVNGPSAPPGREPAAAPAPAAGASISPSHVVRVDLSRLDDLMRITGELVIHRSRLDDRIARGDSDLAGLREINTSLARSLRELRGALTRVRLVPVGEIFTRLPFVVRDLARDHGKRVRLAIAGQQTEIDKFLVERLKEPLLHLVRNAVSHGIGTPAERSASGKPEEAVILLSAATVGRTVEIRIRDDGRGIDRARVAARAAAAGLAVGPEPDDHDLLAVLCRPGFSTRDEADRAAGRGMGLAVVESTLRELGGSFTMTSTAGQGTEFTLRLPVTLSIAEVFIASAAGHVCAIPRDFVQEIMLLATADVREVNQVEIVPFRDGVLPLVRLRSVFRAADRGPTRPVMVVLATTRGLVGLVVDRMLGEREVVVNGITDPLLQLPGISGITDLGDGRPVLILDANSLPGARARANSDAAAAGTPLS